MLGCGCQNSYYLYCTSFYSWKVIKFLPPFPMRQASGSTGLTQIWDGSTLIIPAKSNVVLFIALSNDQSPNQIYYFWFPFSNNIFFKFYNLMVFLRFNAMLTNSSTNAKLPPLYLLFTCYIRGLWMYIF